MKVEWAAGKDKWNIRAPMFKILVCISQKHFLTPLW